MEAQTTDAVNNAATTLEFKGPFHWDHRAKLKLVNNSGIYIWGFMFEVINKNLFLIDFNDIQNMKIISNHLNELPNGFEYKNKNWIFVPFYIGKDKNLNRFIRLSSEINDKKITRLFKGYYDKFFMDIDFPIHNNSDSDWIVNNNTNFADKINECVEYFNNMKILNDYIYPKSEVKNKKYGAKKNDNPIDQIFIENDVLNDSLKNIIDHNNNLWFCYAETATSINLEYPEGQTFFSLKGKTLSKTKNFDTLLKNTKKLYHIKYDNTCKHIFKLNIKNDVVAIERFDGYLKDDPYVI